MATAWLWVPNRSDRLRWSKRQIRHGLLPLVSAARLVSAAADADLLIVGHGPLVIDLVHWSVSWYCAPHAHCPTLVIPAAATTPRLCLGRAAHGPSQRQWRLWILAMAAEAAVCAPAPANARVKWTPQGVGALTKCWPPRAAVIRPPDGRGNVARRLVSRSWRR